MMETEGIASQYPCPLRYESCDRVIEILASSPLLTLFVVVTAGAVIGAIPLGKIRFGAAGALFVGLALSAVAPQLG